MKVALVNNAWCGTGVGRYVYELFSMYKRMKKDFDMIYVQNRFHFGLNDKRIKVLTTPFKFPIWMAAINNYYYFPHKIPTNYDIFHISNQTIAKCCNHVSPSVISCMDIFAYTAKSSYDLFTNFLLKRHLKFFDKALKIITISEHTKKDLIRILNIPEEKIEVIYLGVNFDYFCPRNKLNIRKKYNLPIDQKIILHAGLEEPRKNIPTLIKTFYKLKKLIPDVKLIRISTPTKKYAKLIQDLNLENDIIYLNVNTKEVHLIYNTADLFVFPSYYEGFGLPVLEAMASGVPVITSNTTSLPEVVGDAGIMVDPFDIDGFTRNMYEVLTDESLQKRMSKKGLQRSKMFSWRKVAKETWRIYKEVYF